MYMHPNLNATFSTELDSQKIFFNVLKLDIQKTGGFEICCYHNREI